MLVWIPVSRLRKLRRGYDQSELIARSLSRELGLKRVCALKKIRHTRPQSRISDVAERRANVLGAYRVTIPERVVGKRVLLVDDIFTTGATMSEAARMLKSAGAKEVHGRAVAAKK
jgi:ComF family protein